MLTGLRNCTYYYYYYYLFTIFFFFFKNLAATNIEVFWYLIFSSFFCWVRVESLLAEI